ncbi:hypoxia-inducible factor 1-alpha inhibitor-like isoform X2 [Corticium candelabrum]|uniref:hypoxia-inducible factor 1-alpha inhibitor-like isoform X2 n=1 Tax=Corticium candelabrum TaxID=121492 RepID=UPI002E27493D|nr:hypoxia-inducible factor 1-alpha inhibitor-like isoform X2 [Corticium candelabrum]
MAEKRTRKSRVASNSRLDDYTKLFAVVSTSAIIAVAFFAVYFDEISQRGIKQINVSQFPSNVYREVLQLREPVILTSTVADRWKASKWTFEFLSQRLPYIEVYRQESSRVFMTFHDNKPLEHLVNEDWSDFNKKINVTIPDVLKWQEFDEGHDKSGGEYLYFSRDISLLRDQFPEVVSHISPISDFVVSEGGVQINLWIGRAGIITHTHYDAMYNLFYQIRGQKRFTLFPPSSLLYLYPCLHPHYGHSQVDIVSSDQQKFPLLNRTGEVVVVVNPRELLVVPPFWFHHVETLQDSLSLNVWNDAPEYVVMNKIYTKPVPLELDWSLERRVKATRLYIHQRYYPLYGFETTHPNLQVNVTVIPMIQRACETDWSITENTLSMSDVSRCLSEVVPLFREIGDRDIMKMLAGNYLEHVVRVCVGLDYVYSFFEVCQVTGLK